MDIERRLMAYKKKNITLVDLASILSISQYDVETLYSAVQDMIKNQLIEPVQSSGMNGNYMYPLHMKYRVMVMPDDGIKLIPEIKKLHPTLLKSGYLEKHPAIYNTFRNQIDSLSSYFFKGVGSTYISRKERSFEIFGKEKVLDDSEVKSLLRNLQIMDETLRFYDTPEYCFHDYIPIRKEKMTLLICENKDIWFNIRRRMFEDGSNVIFGTEIDGVVYGNGNKVSQKAGALTEYVKFMGNPQIHFLYWGDIDREGFDIFRRTREVNPLLDIKLFLPGYKKMLERAKAIEIEDSPSSKKESYSFDDLFVEFADEEKRRLIKFIADNKLIPQEIISYVQLSEG